MRKRQKETISFPHTRDVSDGDASVVRAWPEPVDDVIDAESELISFVSRQNHSADDERSTRTLGRKPVVHSERRKEIDKVEEKAQKKSNRTKKKRKTKTRNKRQGKRQKRQGMPGENV